MPGPARWPPRSASAPLVADSGVLRVEVRIPTGGISVFGGFSGLDGAGVLWGSSYRYLDVVSGAGSLLLELGLRRNIWALLRWFQKTWACELELVGLKLGVSEVAWMLAPREPEIWRADI